MISATIKISTTRTTIVPIFAQPPFLLVEARILKHQLQAPFSGMIPDFVTIQYLHSYEQKSIPDQLR